MLPSRRTVLSAMGLSALAVLGACRPQQEDEDEATVQVTGDFGSLPGVDFQTPLPVSRPYTEEVISGEGVELTDGAAVMLSYLAYDAVTGERLVENFTAPPEIRVLGEDVGVLHDELVGRNEGTRLLQVELGTPDRPNPSVLVYDIRHTQAWGEPVELPADAPEDVPRLSAADDGAPQVQVPDGADPPADLQVIPVRRGDGAQVRPGQAVTVRYATVSWSTGEVTDTLWGEGMLPTTIPFTGLIPAWQNGLVDEQVGSRVMLLTPPELAFGTDSLVFVIDVLAVSAVDDPNGEFDEDSPLLDDGDGGRDDDDGDDADADDGDGDDGDGDDGDGDDGDDEDEDGAGDDDDGPAGDEEDTG